MKDSKLRKVTAVLSKVIEVASWLGVVMMVVTTIVLTASKDQIMEAYEKRFLSVDDISLSGPLNSSSTWMLDAIGKGETAFIFIPLAVLFLLLALIFRNVYNIFKSSNMASPFSVENVNRIRNIGIFAIAIPVWKIIGAVICIVGTGSTNYTLSVELSEVVIGLVVLCLSQYFAYGAGLQKDVDGLL